MQPPVWVGSAPGKVILLGEHAVVAGHLALAVALDLRLTVELRPVPGATRLVHDEPDARLAAALAAALPADGLSVRVVGDLPAGLGLGSSAALTVALLRARDRWMGLEEDFTRLHAEGFALERAFHGDPSGLDHAVALLGGAVAYRRGAAPRPVSMPPTWLTLLDSGQVGDTRAMVAGVASRRPAVDPHLERLGELAAEGLTLLHRPAELGLRMTEAHSHLRALGVSSPRLDALVALALDAGACGAKLAGSGGGGVVVALAAGEEHARAVADAASAGGTRAWTCRVPPV